MRLGRRALSGAAAALIAMAGVALVASSVAATPSPSVALVGSVGRSDGGSLTTANVIVVCSAPGLPEWSGNSESPTCSDGEAVVRTSGVSAADTFRIETLGADSYRVALFYEDDPGGIVTSGVAAVTLASGNVATCTLIAGSSPTATCVATGAATVTGTVTDGGGGALFPAGLLICDGPLKAQLNQLNDLCAGGKVELAPGVTAPGSTTVTPSQVPPGTYTVRGAKVFPLTLSTPVTVTVAAGDELQCTAKVPGPTSCSSGDDGDGVDEDPSVDGNGDGTPDAEQPHVTTLAAGVGGGSVTIATEDATYRLKDVSSGPVPPGAPTASFPVGALDFTVDLPAGDSEADVTIIVPPGTNPNAYFKYHDGLWSQYTDVTIIGDTITVHLVDGAAGDDDDVVNGEIIDPAIVAVGYTFSGFQAPIDAGKANIAKGGQTVPVKWRITDAGGNPVSHPASFKALRSNGGVCGSAPTDDVEVYVPGSSGLQYLGDGVWQFGWKTDKRWNGHCRTLILDLADGITGRTAEFQFK